jgi:RNA polymerase sigma-70 factor (ECF subfamily)
MDGLVDNLGPVEEAVLIRYARQGDRQAYRALIERHWDRVYRWLFHLTHDVREAEDAASDTFLRAYSALPMMEPPIAFAPLLFRIAYDSARKLVLPKRTVRLRVPKELRGNEPAAEEIMAAREATKNLLRAVGRLPQPFRGAFLLVVETGFRIDRVAEVLDISERRVRSRLAQARLRLMLTLHPESATGPKSPGCRMHRNLLLRSENPALPDDPSARHLEICPECRRWQSQLARIEADAGSLFVPPARRKERFCHLFLDPPAASEPAAAAAPGKHVAGKAIRIVGWIVVAAILLASGVLLGNWTTELLVSGESGVVASPASK